MKPARLFDFIHFQQENYPLEKCFGYRQPGGWKYFSTAELIRLANRVSLGMLELGAVPGDKIAIVVHQNCPEWVALDIGMQQIGAIPVPVYPSISRREFEYIFNEAEVKYCFCGSADLIEKVLEAQPAIPSLLRVFCFEKTAGTSFWEEIFADGSIAPVEKIKAAIQPDQLATIIYTSGTTGNPKGVMLSHGNVVSNILAIARLAPVQPGDRVLSFLPLCHIFERAATYAYLYIGVSIVQTATDNLGGAQGDLQMVQPHFFTTVPRLLEKVYEKIYNKGLELKGLKRRLFFWALSLTDDFEMDKKYKGWPLLQRKIADRLVYSKWRAALGGNVKGIITAASACPEKIVKVFCAAGIPIREGYGLTEASPGLTFNHFTPFEAMTGTVGITVDGVKIRIDDSDGNYREGEGEVVAAGPNIMLGYYRQPETTAATIRIENGERWLYTGDVGRWVDGPGGHRFLKITDRKKELLKTSGGKYVAPQPIESKFREDFLIEQIMLVGEQQRFVSALIVPAVEALRDWCERHDAAFTAIEEVIRRPEVLARFQRIVDKYNPLFSHIEQVKKFCLLSKPWEAVKTDGSEAELTPTMKLKRRVILEKFRKEITEIYQL